MNRIATNQIVLALTGAMLVTAPPARAQQAVTPVWSSRYNSMGNAADRPAAMAVDGSGNVYVTGGSSFWGFGTSFATVKYDPKGQEQWVARYSGPNGRPDYPRAIGVDASTGGVYVAGWSSSRDWPFYSEATTVKFDPAGALLWDRRYGVPTSRWSSVRALAVDAAGNVYVAGSTTISRTNSDYLTIKYDSSGAECWVRLYDGPAGTGDGACAVAVDDSGGVYVTGRSVGIGGTSRDYATVKYDVAGNELWVARYNGPLGLYDEAVAVAVDDSGNVYVTGVADASFWRVRGIYTTIKYDSNGSQVWVAHYDGPESGSDVPVAIGVDREGSVFVTGTSDARQEVGGTEYATVKYDSDGNELWVARYDGPPGGDDEVNGLALDASGNIYITGVSDLDYATVKYDKWGRERWAARFDGPLPFNEWDEATAVSVDGSGNVFVTGHSWSDPQQYADFVTIKYAQRRPGDLNCNGAIDAFDIEPFLLALFDPDEYEIRFLDCDINLADLTGDGSVNAFDIEPFMELLFP